LRKINIKDNLFISQDLDCIMREIKDTIADRLFAANCEEVTRAIKDRRVKLLRHSPVGGLVKEDLLFDKLKLEKLTSEQKPRIFENVDYVFCFMAEEGSACSYIGGFKVNGILDIIDAREKYNIKSDTGSLVFYDLTYIEIFDDYLNRLLIDWGESTISWHQRKTDKQIIALRPRGFFKTLPRWNRISLSFRELEFIVQNEIGNPMWRTFLSSVDGIYLIRHISANQMYVGSAYGETEGVWGRWRGYIETIHNGNKGMIDFLQTNDMMHHEFKFSLLEIFPKGTQKKAVIAAENFYKEMLGTRIFGLNRN
jgi:hypothetical protein